MKVSNTKLNFAGTTNIANHLRSHGLLLEAVVEISLEDSNVNQLNPSKLHISEVNLTSLKLKH